MVPIIYFDSCSVTTKKYRTCKSAAKISHQLDEVVKLYIGVLLNLSQVPAPNRATGRVQRACSALLGVLTSTAQVKEQHALIPVVSFHLQKINVMNCSMASVTPKASALQHSHAQVML